MCQFTEILQSIIKKTDFFYSSRMTSATYRDSSPKTLILSSQLTVAIVIHIVLFFHMEVSGYYLVNNIL